MGCGVHRWSRRSSGASLHHSATGRLGFGRSDTMGVMGGVLGSGAERKAVLQGGGFSGNGVRAPMVVGRVAVSVLGFLGTGARLIGWARGVVGFGWLGGGSGCKTKKKRKKKDHEVYRTFTENFFFSE